MMQGVLFRGYFGHGNWGDEILLRALVLGLTTCDVSPDRMFYWIGKNPDFDPVDIGHACAREATGIRAWTMTGTVIFTGGIFYDHLPQFGSRRLKWILTLVRITRAAGKKVAIFGVTIGPLVTSEGRRLTREIVKLANAVWVRDRQSFKICRSWGVTCRLIPDPAVVLASRVFALPRPPVQPRILFLPCAGGLASEPQSGLIKSLGQVARHHGLTVGLVPIHAGQDNALAQRLAEQHHLEIISMSSKDPMQLFQMLMTARLVVSVRLHGGWAAYLGGRPLLQINYQSKCRGLVEMVHLPETCFLDPFATTAEVGKGVDEWLAPEKGRSPKLVPPGVLEGRTMAAMKELASLLH